MDFGWTAEQQELYERMRALGERAGATPAGERLGLLAANGALGLPLGREHRGGGWDLVSTAYAYEALGSTLADAGVLLAAGAHLFGVALSVQRLGTPEQRARWLPSLAAGELLATVAATERDSGSDIGAVQSVVEPVAGGFQASGEKCFVTAAATAGLFLFVGRAGREGRGLTTALVPAGLAGVSVGEPLRTTGLHSAGLAPVSFDACALDAEAILGRPGAGMAVFQTAMCFERALVLAFRLGAMQRGLDEAISFARTRSLGGRPIRAHQAVAHRVARMKLRLDASRLLVYRAAWELDCGGRAQLESALAKWHVADAALQSALDAARLQAGAGYLEASGLGAAVADAVGGTIHSGTQDVMATIAARCLGL
ncbi:MAG: acyl-CoA dehydrogenase family protein [Deltaproteobacteria bacterium]|nr:acyl-CoA dehydrogenase family protein [Deltaproteobacteria bacterium]